MTCREKLKLEHPEFVDDRWAAGCKGCPHDYGYLKKPDYCVINYNESLCASCWNRVIPEGANPYDEATKEYYKLFESFMNSGFNSEQAFELIKAVTLNGSHVYKKTEQT